MIPISLLLILVAVVLLALGLTGGSSGLLIASIVASLLAAVALVIGARRNAVARRAASAGRPTGPAADYPAADQAAADYPVGDYSARPAADYPAADQAAADYPAGDYPARPAADYSARPAADYSAQAAPDYLAEPVVDYEAEPVVDYAGSSAPFAAEPSAQFSAEPAADYAPPPPSSVPPPSVPPPSVPPSSVPPRGTESVTYTEEPVDLGLDDDEAPWQTREQVYETTRATPEAEVATATAPDYDRASSAIHAARSEQPDANAWRHDTHAEASVHAGLTDDFDEPDADDPDDEPLPQAVQPADAVRVARMDAEVLVVDGRPRYHLADCPHLAGRATEPIAVNEAVELGFSPCGLCRPVDHLVAAAAQR